MPKRNSRALILAAARDEFGSRGYDGARVARIARRAGVNKQLIFYYFRSKAGLHTAVTSQSTSNLTMQRAGSGPATETVRRSIEALFGQLEDRPELVTSLVAPQGTRAPGPDRALAELERGLAAVISDGQGLGYFRDDADPHLVARQGVVLCVGFLALGAGRAGADGEQWAREVGETLVRRLAW